MNDYAAVARSVAEPLVLTRRRAIQATIAASASAILLGSDRWFNANALAATFDPQKAATGTLTPASLTVTVGDDGSIGQDFVGFSYEKTALSQPLFLASNSDLIGIFKCLGPGVLRIGGNLVGMNSWDANGAGKTSGQIAPSDVDALAAFLNATG